MKITKILLTLLVTFTFSSAVNADGYKFKVCKNAETSLWDTIRSSGSSTDKSLVASLDKKDKAMYFKIELAKLEESMADVRSRCRSVSPDQQTAYNKKKSKFLDQLNSL